MHWSVISLAIFSVYFDSPVQAPLIIWCDDFSNFQFLRYFKESLSPPTLAWCTVGTDCDESCVIEHGLHCADNEQTCGPGGPGLLQWGWWANSLSKTERKWSKKRKQEGEKIEGGLGGVPGRRLMRSPYKGCVKCLKQAPSKGSPCIGREHIELFCQVRGECWRERETYQEMFLDWGRVQESHWSLNVHGTKQSTQDPYKAYASSLTGID